jgi:hypothetical protein
LGYAGVRGYVARPNIRSVVAYDNIEERRFSHVVACDDANIDRQPKRSISLTRLSEILTTFPLCA